MKKILFVVLSFLTFNLFAQRTVGIFQNDTSSYNGYTLISPINSEETYLIDNCGDQVHSWKNSQFKPGASVYLLPNGSLIRTGKITTGEFIAGGSGGKIQQFDWNDNLIWDYTLSDSITRQHHDIHVLPNGNVLALAWDKRTAAQAIQLGLDTNHYNGDVWGEKIVEIVPSSTGTGGTIVWEWSLWDHIIQDWDSSAANFGNVGLSPEKVDLNYANNNGISADYFHANGIDYNPILDQIVISVRNYDEIWVIDHSTTTQQAAGSTGGNSNKGGDIIYRWGNPEACKNGTIADKKLFGQHNPTWIPAGHRNAGDMLVFNNGYNDTNQVSRVHRLELPLDTAGNYTRLPNRSFFPDTAVWTYNLPVFVDFVSGAQSLPNGNILICSGPDGHLYELDSLDQQVWKYVNPTGPNGMIISQGSPAASNTLFRAYRYGTSYPAFSNRNLSPRSPIETNPIASNCTVSTSLNDHANFLDNNVTIIQNPIINELKIESNTYKDLNIDVYNLTGKLIFSTQSKEHQIFINTSGWSSDLYLIIFNDGNSISTRKVLKL